MIPLFAQAQSSAERSALKYIKKNKWERAYDALQKARDKDSTSVVTYHAFASYFNHIANPAYNTDSAYRYIIWSIEKYDEASGRKKEKLGRISIDSITLIRHRQSIDSAAFEQAKVKNTEQAYNHFLTNYTFAAQRAQAQELLYEAAYQDALQVNSYNAFLSFLKKYPQAKHVTQAKSLYEQLLYKGKTQGKRLQDFLKFIEDNPSSPYREDAEKQIFMITTAPGKIGDFEAFIQRYPLSKVTRRASAIVYHLLKEDTGEGLIPEFLQTDSIKNLEELHRGYLIPFLNKDGYGFMNEKGNEIIAAQPIELNKEYLCGNITEDVIVFPDKILAKNGAVVFEGEVSALDDLGFGFLKVQTSNCLKVVHLSGYLFHNSCIDDAKLLNGKLLALLKDNKWSVWSLAGQMLQPFVWDDIAFFKDVLVFKKEDLLQLSTISNIAAAADQLPAIFIDSVQEVKLWPSDLVWVKKDSLESLFDQQLTPIVKAARQNLTPAFFGSVAHTSHGIKVFTSSGATQQYFNNIQITEPWVALKTDSVWNLYDPSKNLLASKPFDTLTFSGLFATGFLKDSAVVAFASGQRIGYGLPVKFEFIPGDANDSSSFLLVIKNDKGEVYDKNGVLLFNTSYQKVEYAGKGFFIVHNREKKGLIDISGKTVLPVEYDAIGRANNGMISLLKGMRFGLYNYSTKKIIKTQYEKNILPYSPSVISVFKNGAYSLIGWDNKPLSNFEFSEIKYWNDTTALVKKGSLWYFYHIDKKTFILQDIKEVKLIRDTPYDKLAIIRHENNYGVFSSVKGAILPLRFSDIVNVGSADHPTYFTEKHVEEASIFVVIYYDHEGHFLRREVYEHDDYEKIYCSDQ